MAKIRSEGKIALAVATSGIAASLLDDGYTVHSLFKCPVDIDKDSTCDNPVDSNLAELIRKADLIIWDEAVMAHRDMYSTIDRSFKDIMGCTAPANRNKFFGNKIMLFGGDFRQILPVVPKGNRSAIVNASLNNTKFWHLVKVFKLTENMRIKSAALNIGVCQQKCNEFAEYLLKIGEGLIPNLINSRYQDDIMLPKDIAKNIDELELIKKVFPDIEKNYNDSEFMTTRAILAPKNAEVDHINTICSNYFPGTPKSYYSTDSVISEKDQRTYNLFYTILFMILTILNLYKFFRTISSRISQQNHSS